MIPKGNQRGGGLQLAAHLQNTFDNDSVEIADLRGAVAPSLAGAFSEWQAQAKGTKCKEYLYSLSLNPDKRQGNLPRDQYMDFIARTEKRLKLENQPRAVVFHVKHGREHCHVVWSRIDTEKMRAVPMSNDHQNLRKVAQEFAKDHGLTLPEGMRKDKGKERYEEQKKIADLHEKQQEERTGFSKVDRMKAITEAWSATKTGNEFVRTLAEKDFYIARGDKGRHVVVDLAGEVHSLARQIMGVNTRQLKERLAFMPPEKLPNVEQAQEYAAQMRDYRQKVIEQQRAKEQAPAPAKGPSPDDRRKQLQAQQEQQRLALSQAHEAQRLKRAREAGQLAIEHAKINAGIVKHREDLEAKRKNVSFPRVFLFAKILLPFQYVKDFARERKQKYEMEALQQRHNSERRDAEKETAALLRVHKRETKSLETSIRRDEFQRIAGLDKGQSKESQGKTKLPEKEQPTLQPAPELRQSFQAAAQPGLAKSEPQPKARFKLSEMFGKAAGQSQTGKSLDTGTSSGKGSEGKGSDSKGSDGKSVEPELVRPSLRSLFGDAAKPPPTPEPEKSAGKSSGLSGKFNRAGGKGDGPDKGGFDKSFRRMPTDYAVRR